MIKSKEVRKTILILFAFSLSEIVVCWLLNSKYLIYYTLVQSLTSPIAWYIAPLYLVISFPLYPLFITLPFFCGLAIFRILVKGWFAEPIYESVNKLAWGSFIYLMVANDSFLYDPLVSPAIRQALFGLQPFGQLIIYSTIVITSYKLVCSLTRKLEQEIPAMLSRALAIVLEGFVLKHFLSSVLLQGSLIGVWDHREIQIPISDIVFIGAVTAGVTSSFYPLYYSKNRYLSYIGELLGSNPDFKFIIGAFLFFYFVTLRPVLFDRFTYYVSILEWIIVCLISFNVYVALKRNLKTVTEPLSTGDWIKHLQLVEVKGDKDLTEISEYVEKFVSKGDKSGVITYLICLMAKNEINEEEITKAVSDLINYEDIEVPRLAFSWDIRQIELENGEMRKKVLSKVINNVKSTISSSTRRVECGV